MTQCSEDGCDRPSFARGLCDRDYQRLRAAGGVAPRASLSERLARGMDRSAGPNGCWPWLRGKTDGGYGTIKVKGKTRMVHVVAWELENGPVPKGRNLDHRCHTDDRTCCGGNSCPHRACGNPSHLELVTLRENILRGLGPSAENARKTHCDQGHPLGSVGKARGCRICQHNNRLAWIAKGIAGDDPRHGSVAGYVAGCRLACCKAASAEYARQRRRKTLSPP